MLKVYKVSDSFPKSELYSLIGQIRSAALSRKQNCNRANARTALSVPSNIAEAVGRFHYSESAKFLFNARGSAFEVRSQLRAARDLGYINSEAFKSLDNDYESLVKGINSYVNYLLKMKNQSANEPIFAKGGSPPEADEPLAQASG